MTELNNYEKNLLTTAGLNARLPNRSTNHTLRDDNNPSVHNDTDYTFATGSPAGSNRVTGIDGRENFPKSNGATGNAAVTFNNLVFLRDSKDVPLFTRLFTGEDYFHTPTASVSITGARRSYQDFFDTINGIPNIHVGTTGHRNGLGNYINGLNYWGANTNKLETFFFDAFAYFTGIKITGNRVNYNPSEPARLKEGVTDLGALADLSDGGTNPATNAALQQTTLNGRFDRILNDKELAVQMFKQTFNAFLKQYNWPQNVPLDPASGKPNHSKAFWAGWLRFLSARTAVNEDAAAQFAQGVSHAVDYRGLYDAFVPGGNSQDYKERLVSVYREAILRDGYFLPSHHLADWVTEIQQAAAFKSGRTSPVEGTGSERVQVLMRLFRLLVTMIDILQKVTAAQADRLGFYAAYQKAYTELMGTVPVIDQAFIGIGGKVKQPFEDKTDYTATLSQLQSKTGAWSEKLRSYRSNIGDEAKQHQTAVNQSNEIVNQQAQLGTSLLQQMSTILTTIFK